MLDDLINQFKNVLFSIIHNDKKEQEPIKSQTIQAPIAKSQEKQSISGFVPPVKGQYYNSGDFSPNTATDKNHKNGHQGIDVRAECGAIACSMADGVIIQTQNTPKGGLNLVIKFDNGYRAYYAHLNSITVKPKQKVKQGEQIGTVGNTGNAAGGVCHIHLEVRDKNGTLIDPSQLFPFPKYTAYTKEERIRDKAKKAVANYYVDRR